MARLKAFDEDRALDLAVDCFWSRGYEATSVRDLADSMGIGGASLYNTYGDKRALFVVRSSATPTARCASASPRGHRSRRSDPGLPGRDHRPLGDRSGPQGLPAGEFCARRRAARCGDRQGGRRLSRRDPGLLPPQHRGGAQGRPAAEDGSMRSSVLRPPAGRGAGHPRAGENRGEAEAVEAWPDRPSTVRGNAR